jgi:hypothetical protein
VSPIYPSKPEAEESVLDAEYGSRGGGGKSDGRVTWAKALSAAEAETYTLGRILGQHRGEKWFER